MQPHSRRRSFNEAAGGSDEPPKPSFGCSAHGDAIRWMTDQRGLPFMDAVKELAQAAGMEMPAMDPRAAEKAEAAKGLHEACADAATWFTEQLNGLPGATAREVLLAADACWSARALRSAARFPRRQSHSASTRTR